MTPGLKGLGEWLRARWDGPRQFQAFLDKPLPRNVSWLHTLGSLLLFYLVLQAITGVLLGLYYSGSPDQAYASVHYIRNELRFGALVHSLHKHGAGFILVTAVLHLARSYFLAAYRRPRELVWWSGLLLVLVLALFAFTGQLLPWDQRGYWATVVGIRIASSTPLVADATEQLLTGGYGDIGATTLSRFLILHVCVLPVALFALVGLHLKLLQKSGSAGPLSGSPEPLHAFFPRQAFKDLIVSAGGALVLFLVAWFFPFGDSGPAAPDATGFVPRPEWYFYAHYELLRMLPAGLQGLGTWLLPGVVLGGLFALPLIDRGEDRAFGKRRLLTVLGLGVAIGAVGLTITGFVAEAHEEAPAVESSDKTGSELFVQHKCIKCHTIDSNGGDKGPNLSHVASRLRPGYLKPWIRNPRKFKPDSEMPSFEGSEQELAVLTAYLQSLK